MRIAVIGSTGMLGTAMMKAGIDAGLDMIGVTRNDVDITDRLSIHDMIIDMHGCDTAINCAGIVKGTDVPDSEYYKVNSAAPLIMAEVFNSFDGIPFVQISTDCVFSDFDTAPYYEYHFNFADDIYAKSKRLGEIVKRTNLTIRCSFVGFGKHGLLTWLTQQKGQVEGYRNYKWNGLSVKVAAQRIIEEVVNRNKSHDYETGLIHLYGQDTNKYEVLKAANEIFELGLEVIPVDEPAKDLRLRSIYNWNFVDISIEEQLKGLIDDFSCRACRP